MESYIWQVVPREEVQVLGVGLGMTVGEAASFRDINGLTYPYLADDEWEAWDLYYLNGSVPMSYVMDQDFIVHYRTDDWTLTIRNKILALIDVLLTMDNDGDEYLEDVDCDDDDPEVYPGADEVCNGTDDDCDGLVPADEVDDDLDGWMICDGDCDDGEAAVNPGIVESGDQGNCGDGIDNDCDSLVDADPECGGCFVKAVF